MIPCIKTSFAMFDRLQRDETSEGLVTHALSRSCMIKTVQLLKKQDLSSEVLFVQAFCFANMAPQAPQPSLSEDKYVALVSGLGLGDDAGDPLKLSLLVDYLVGSLASDEEQTRVSKVCNSCSLCCQLDCMEYHVFTLPLLCRASRSACIHICCCTDTNQFLSSHMMIVA